MKSASASTTVGTVVLSSISMTSDVARASRPMPGPTRTDLAFVQRGPSFSMAVR
jgi:hypothetical protein